VVAAAGGGHLETVGRLTTAALFRPGDADDAGARLRSLLSEERRASLSAQGRALVERELTIEQHVDRLVREYETVLSRSGRVGLAPSC